MFMYTLAYTCIDTCYFKDIPYLFSVLLVCWANDVMRFALQFDESVQIDDVISVQGVQSRTCIHNNDTIYYRRKHKNEDTFHVLLNLPATQSVPLVFR
jgi:hypothetical protein